MSYCDKGDFYCGTSVFDIDEEVHVSYVDIYGDDVVDLVVDAYNNFEPEFDHDRTGLATTAEEDGAASGFVASSLLAVVPMLLAGAMGLML